MARLGKFVAKLRDEMKQGRGNSISFEQTVEIDGETRTCAMYATLLPGDDLEPVVTVLTQDND